MIQFFRTKKCPRCREIEEAIRDLCLAHEVVIVDEGRDLPESVPAGTKPPFLIDNGELIVGSGKITEHLSELEAFKELWYKFQSDACYCDDSGEAE